MFKAVITTVVMALSEKQKNCSSDKTTTVCGDSSESLQLPTKPHSRGCESTYNKVLFTPPTMCRLTATPLANGCVKAKTAEDTTDTVYTKWYDAVYVPVTTAASTSTSTKTTSTSS